MRKVTCGSQKHQEVQNANTINIQGIVLTKGWYSLHTSVVTTPSCHLSHLFFLKNALNAKSYDTPLCFPLSNMRSDDKLWSHLLYSLGWGIRVRVGILNCFQAYGIMHVLTGCLISMCSVSSNPYCFFYLIVLVWHNIILNKYLLSIKLAHQHTFQYLQSQ